MPFVDSVDEVTVMRAEDIPTGSTSAPSWEPVVNWDARNPAPSPAPCPTPPPAPVIEKKIVPVQINEDKDLLSRMKQAEASVRAARRELDHQNRVPTPWTQTNRFSSAVGLVIVLNALTMGAETDFGRKSPVFFEVLEFLFAIIFLVELLLHLKVEGPRFYFADKANWLDFALVVMSVTDAFVIQQIGLDADMRLVSLMRLLRLTRLARLLRLFRLFKELTLIIEGFIGGARALTWAMLFLLLMVYIFGIFARLQVGARYVCADGETEPGEGETCPADAGGGDPTFVFAFNEEIGDQRLLFGSMPLTMLTLIVCLTEGCGLDVVHPTTRVSPMLVFFWIVFVLVTTFGILNLIIGIFCENMLKISRDCDHEISRSQDELRQQNLGVLRTAFTRMDTDGDAEISRDEFARAIVENPAVVTALTALGLDEEKDLFDTIDADHSGSVEFSEFFDGIMLIMKGQEPALAKDMVSTYLRVSGLYKAHQSMEDNVQKMREGQNKALAKIDKKITAMQAEHERILSRIEGLLDRADAR